MTVDQLTCFLAVIKYGNFSKAAEALYVSHSAVSKIISALEDDVGAQLMVRDNRSVTLTPAGELLLDRGGHILMLWHDLEERVRAAGQTVHGSLTFLTPHLNVPDIFPICKKMSERFPRVSLSVQQCEPLVIYRSVMMGHADVGITFSFAIPEEDDTTERITLCKDRFFAVVSPDHPFAGLQEVQLAQIMEQPMIFPPSVNLNREYDIMKRVKRQRLPGDYQAFSLDDTLFQIALGRGVAILPGRVLYGDNSGCITLPISDLAETFELVLLWRNDNHNIALPHFLSLSEYAVPEDPVV